ncbi:cell division protein SepF [Vulcanococcus sp.]|jgi:cell division inhibitor SepF|uniref:cell division protein SepF n=1 Tax=Vulcanococcus sp. TaxID=2856995 RepID=UPI00323A1516
MQTPFGIWLPQVTVLRCEQFEKAVEAVEAIRERQCVVLQLEGLESAEAQRILDFVSGATHALDGQMERVGEGTYLFAPSGVEVTRTQP